MAHAYTLQRQSDRNHTIALIDGPNMSNLGGRSKRTYGSIASLQDLQAFVVNLGKDLGVTVETFDSNHMGDILEYIHESAHRVDGYIINPAGLTTVGEAVRHALEETERPTIEVHFANISAVAGVQRGLVGGTLKSTFTHTATGLAMGLRQYSYSAALLGLVQSLDDDTFLGQPG
ncbi:MAG: type II 3-dehydroquinate dehydratase [Planctomycetota bacterium]